MLSLVCQILLSHYESLLLLVVDHVIHLYAHKLSEVREVDLSPVKREQFLVVSSHRDVRLVVDSVIHLPCSVVVVNPPLVEDELLEAKQKDESHEVLSSGVSFSCHYCN